MAARLQDWSIVLVSLRLVPWLIIRQAIVVILRLLPLKLVGQTHFAQFIGFLGLLFWSLELTMHSDTTSPGSDKRLA